MASSFKKYKLKLNILTGIDVMAAKGTRAAMCHFVYRYERANNKYMRL